MSKKKLFKNHFDDNATYAKLLTNYLEVLMTGRNKPHNNKQVGGSVRESLGECDDIAQVKARLNKIFALDSSVKYHDKPKKKNDNF